MVQKITFGHTCRLAGHEQATLLVCFFGHTCSSKWLSDQNYGTCITHIRIALVTEFLSFRIRNFSVNDLSTYFGNLASIFASEINFAVMYYNAVMSRYRTDYRFSKGSFKLHTVPTKNSIKSYRFELDQILPKLSISGPMGI